VATAHASAALGALTGNTQIPRRTQVLEARLGVVTHGSAVYPDIMRTVRGVLPFS
jgi:hypothetical protein